jgi:hypothetical protein
VPGDIVTVLAAIHHSTDAISALAFGAGLGAASASTSDSALAF